jgi:hypothetical protein
MFSSFAAAATFDQLSDRLRQYDDQNGGVEQTRTRGFVEAPDQGQGPFNPGGDPYGDANWDGGPCCDNSCDMSCGPPRGFYGRAEYVLWWVRGANTPALVTTSPNGTPSAEAGVLPGANVLFGDQKVNNQARSGGRFTLGYWLGDTGLWSVEDTFFFVGNATTNFQASSDGAPILARPFFNTLTNAQDSVLLAFPNSVVGTVKIAATQQLYGNEINLRRAIYWDDFRRIDVLAGYRFLYLNEGLQASTFTTSIATGGAVPVGTTFSVVDNFSTRNNFNGGQLGLNAEFFDGRWSLNLRGKIALGSVTQRVNINGSTTTAEPGSAPVTNAGGILALSSNSGQFNRGQFGVLPEFGADLRFQLTPLWRLNVGYSVMGLSNVLRPGDQVDTNLNPNLFPPVNGTATSPAFTFHNSNLLIQGFNAGIECNF